MSIRRKQKEGKVTEKTEKEGGGNIERRKAESYLRGNDI